MSEHQHAEFVTGCYRCDLHRDEVNAWIDEFVIVVRPSGRGMWHEPDCHHGKRAASKLSARGANPTQSDVACSACLMGQLPIRPLP